MTKEQNGASVERRTPISKVRVLEGKPLNTFFGYSITVLVKDCYGGGILVGFFSFWLKWLKTCFFILNVWGERGKIHSINLHIRKGRGMNYNWNSKLWFYYLSCPPVFRVVEKYWTEQMRPKKSKVSGTFFLLMYKCFFWAWNKSDRIMFRSELKSMWSGGSFKTFFRPT